MKYAFVAGAMLMLSTATMAETTVAGICGKYSTELAELAANIQGSDNLDDANDYIRIFTQAHPEAETCVGTNEQVAAALASIEPAAGDEDSGSNTPSGEAEVPSQLNEQETTEEEAPPEEESLPPPEEEEEGPCEEQYYE